jgi:uncharacterized Zn finger protein
MVEENKSILCKKCGNDKFVVKESILGAFALGCSECGEGNIFGAGLTARDILFILKGEDEKVV